MEEDIHGEYELAPNEIVSQQMQSYTFKVLHTETPRLERIQYFHKLAYLFEREGKKYSDILNTNPDADREEYAISHLQALYTENEELHVELNNILIHSKDRDLITAVIRLVLYTGPNCLEFVAMTEEEEADFCERLQFYIRSPDTSPVLLVFCIGVLAFLLEENELTSKVARSDTPRIVLKRLQKLVLERDCKPYTKDQVCAHPGSNAIELSLDYALVVESVSEEVDQEDPKLELLHVTEADLKWDKVHYSLLLLQHVSQYVDVVAPVLQDSGFEILQFVLSTEDDQLLSDGLYLLAQLFTYQKFASVFVDRNGIQMLSSMQRKAVYGAPLSSALNMLTNFPNVIEQICLLPEQLLVDLLDLAVWLVQLKDEGAKWSFQFFGRVLCYRTFGDIFTRQGYLTTFLNELKKFVDELEENKDCSHYTRTLVYYLIVALVDYFASRIVNLAAPYVKNQPTPRYKRTDLTYDVIDLSIRQLLSLQSQQQVSLLEVTEFISQGGCQLILTAVYENARVSTSQTASEIVQYGIELLWIITSLEVGQEDFLELYVMAPVVRRDFDAGGLDLLEGVERSLWPRLSFAHVERVIMDEFVNDRQLSPHIRAALDRGEPIHVPREEVGAAGSGHGGMMESSSVYEPIDVQNGEPSVQSSTTNDEQHPTKYKVFSLPMLISLIDRYSNNPVTSNQPILHALQVLTNFVSNNSAGAKGKRISRAAESQTTNGHDESYLPFKNSLKVIRSNNGLSVLVSLLKYREIVQTRSLIPQTAPVSDWNWVRTVACRVLLGLSSDQTIRQVLSKKLSYWLPELLREPCPSSSQRSTHTAFRNVAMELMTSLLGKNVSASGLTESQAPDRALTKLERATIAASTPIHYSSTELLELIVKHLDSKGYHKTSQSLIDEANLCRNKITQPSPHPRRTKRHFLGMTSSRTTLLNKDVLPILKPQPDVAPMDSGFLSEKEDFTLDTIIKQFLFEQHRRCRHPSQILPDFSLRSRHTCYVPMRDRLHASRSGTDLTNLSMRLLTRQALPQRASAPMWRKYKYSRYCPQRPINIEDVMLTSVEYSGDDTILLGSESGQVLHCNVKTGNVIDEWECSSRLIWIRYNNSTNKVLTISAYPTEDIHLWDIKKMHQPISVLPLKRANFNTAGTEVVGTTSSGKIMIWDIESQREIIRLDNPSSTLENRRNNFCMGCFSPDDALVLNYASLWDKRIPSPIHRFDRFTQEGPEVFNPNGLEVIINSEIWDVRSFKLIRTCPALDMTFLKFSNAGDVIFAGLCTSSFSSASNTPYSNRFRAIDATSYELITEISLDKIFTSIAVHPDDTQLVFVETLGQVLPEGTQWRVWDIGSVKSVEFQSDDEDEFHSTDVDSEHLFETDDDLDHDPNDDEDDPTGDVNVHNEDDRMSPDDDDDDDENLRQDMEEDMDSDYSDKNDNHGQIFGIGHYLHIDEDRPSSTRDHKSLKKSLFKTIQGLIRESTNPPLNLNISASVSNHSSSKEPEGHFLNPTSTSHSTFQQNSPATHQHQPPHDDALPNSSSTRPSHRRRSRLPTSNEPSDALAHGDLSPPRPSDLRRRRNRRRDQVASRLRRL